MDLLAEDFVHKRADREQRDAYFSRIKPEHPKEDALWASSHGLNSRMLRPAAEALLTPDANVPQIFDSSQFALATHCRGC